MAIILLLTSHDITGLSCATVEPVVAVLLSAVDFKSLVARVSALATPLVRPFWCWGFGGLSGVPVIAVVPALVNIRFAYGVPPISASLLLPPSLLLLTSPSLMAFHRFWCPCYCWRPLMFYLSCYRSCCCCFSYSCCSILGPPAVHLVSAIAVVPIFLWC